MRPRLIVREATHFLFARGDLKERGFSRAETPAYLSS